MSFYNRLPAAMVRPFTNLLGSVEPLDVVQYGGLQKASLIVNSSGNTQILAAAPVGKTYALHSWTWRATGAVPTTGDVFIWDGSFVYADNTFAATVPGGPLGGQLVNLAALNVFNNCNTQLEVYLTYDIVTFPNMN